MWLSDQAVKRPIFATVLNLLLVVFGIFSVAQLSVREYPDIDIPVVSVETLYSGASAAIMETQVTQILENQLAGIEGVRRITSASQEGRSSINIEFELSRDIDAGANDVRDRVSRVLSELPEQADSPRIQKADADASPIVWFVLTSDRLSNLELSDYANRYILDQLRTIDGVADVRLGGSLDYAMRVEIDRHELAARGLTAEDVENALRNQNVERPAGRIESLQREFTLRTPRAFESAEAFRNLVIARGDDGFVTRLDDVAHVLRGAENPRTSFKANGVLSLGLGVLRTSTANTLSVAKDARAEVERLRATLPEGMNIELNFDSSEFIEGALTEVIKTLIYASLMVVVVIFLFLGSIKATLIPAVTVPISLLASFIFLYMFGFSINILTLLALVLAIGLVVDDAIVMIENIHRRLELGEPPLLASYRGAREVGFAIVATTAVLIAVFTPLAFLDGQVGRLFREFALALAASVFCSSIVALTLAPVLASALFKAKKSDGHSEPTLIDRLFNRLSAAYTRLLETLITRVWIGVALFLLLLGASALFMTLVKQEFVPFEDRGGFFISVVGPEGASFPAMLDVMDEVEAPLVTRLGGEIERLLVRVPGFGSGDEVNSGFVIATLSDWDSGRRGTDVIAEEVGREVANLLDARAFVIPRQGFGLRLTQAVQVTIGGGTFDELAQWRDRVLARAADELPGLVRLDSDYRATKPQIELDIDLDKAADLGVTNLQIAQTLETFMSGRRVTTYEDDGEEYNVLIQAPDDARRSPDVLDEIYVRSSQNELVPLAMLVSTREVAAAATLNRLDRVRTITLSAGLAPGYTLGEALEDLETLIREELPEQVQVNYSGESRDFKDSAQSIFLVFGMALLVVYLVLAAQFESFVHPLVVMSTVPLAIFGALLGLLTFDQSFNIYSQIGMVMLIGMAAKNGILIVEFANQQRDAGMAFDEALITASAIRLRPILMTTLSTVAGAVPLILSSGAGSEARMILGLVVFGGVALSAVITLVVVPCFYALLCRKTGSPNQREHALDALYDREQVETGARAPSPPATRQT
ncbi:efflux RND transporter permease subunit [Polycyclovorans algicola]|uniref:efflux RND transporter permease subunit n=1 Tax=Polycyclovorans algicola TaxID=616992 RepID=UPI0006946B19|nr:efflux RND transporter permease subunit [Polycyclovorans algicola]